MSFKSESDQALSIIKHLLDRILAFKFVYMILLILSLLFAYYYNKYATKIYVISTTLGPVKDVRSASVGTSDYISNYSTGKTIEEAINNLSSFDLIYKTVNNLNFEVGYFVDSSRVFKKYQEIYRQAPFIVNIDKSKIQSINTKFFITVLSDSTYRLEVDAEEVALYNYIENTSAALNHEFRHDSIYKFNETVSNWNYNFSLVPNEGMLSTAITLKKRYYFELYNPEELTKLIMKSLSIRPVSYMAAIIRVQFTGINLEKSIFFLNNFASLFLDENLAKKNKIALSTINFIDSQISEMSDSLVTSETELSSFKSSNQYLDLSYQGRRVYDEMASLEADRNRLDRQINYYNSILNQLGLNQEVSSIITSPSAVGVSNPSMESLIEELNDLITERSGYADRDERNIFLTRIDTEIKTKKQVIIDNAANNINATKISLNELNNKVDRLRRDLYRLPRQELNMVNIQRKYNLNNEQYSYMLQKRNEAYIALASTYPDFEVLDPAREVTARKIKPKIKTNYAIALFIALFIPTLIVLLRFILNKKISDPESLENLIERPIFASIYSNPKKLESVVVDSPRSAISESFRNLRSSLFLKLKSDSSKIIMITSSQPQDGKSFVSLNLASSIASLGLKTVLIDCDLRRPTMHNKFNNSNLVGLTNYLTDNVVMDEIIFKSSLDNLYIIPSGPIVLNPSELIGKEAFERLINSLKTKFDFVVLDTPPLGIVSDTIQLTKFALQILLVTRLNATTKGVLKNALTVLSVNKINDFEVVLNDVSIKKSPYSEYRSYYVKD